MIAFVEGNFAHKTPTSVIIEANGIGYDINISLYTYDKIQSLSKGRLLTYLRITENEHSLFGFFEDSEKQLFLQLISVSGVGPSTARVMLSGAAPAELASAIALGNVKVLEKVKGIGAKTAQRIVLELKDKVGKLNMPISESTNTPQNNMQIDALNALVSLGIARSTAVEAVKKAQASSSDVADLQDLIKLALKNI